MDELEKLRQRENRKQWLIALRWWIIIAIVVVGSWRGIQVLNGWVAQNNREKAAHPNGVPVWNPGAICKDVQFDDAKGVNDHGQKHEEWFTVDLTPGCFGSWVRVPFSWSAWNIDFLDPNDNTQYFGIWFYGGNAQGPFRRMNMPNFQYPPVGADGRHAQWRLQGKGTLRYMRTR